MKQQAIDSELKKILQWHYSCSRVWEAWQYWTMNQDDFSPLEEDENIYNDIRALFEEKWNGWIPVTERLPEDNTFVLVCSPEWIVNKAYAQIMSHSAFFVRDWENLYVTHWMNLPDSPK